jgi:hypothetical protein
LSGQFNELQHRLPEIERAWHLYQIEPVEPQGLFSPQEISGVVAGLQAEMALFKGEAKRWPSLSEIDWACGVSLSIVLPGIVGFMEAWRKPLPLYLTPGKPLL